MTSGRPSRLPYVDDVDGGAGEEWNVVRVLRNSPAALDAVRSAVGALHAGSALPAELRELAILRVAARRGADYEWGRHVLMAPERGVPEALVQAARHGDVTGLSEIERAVMALAEAVDDGHAADEVWAYAQDLLTPAEILEVLAWGALYGMLIRITDVVEIELDDDLHDVRLDSERWSH